MEDHHQEDQSLDGSSSGPGRSYVDEEAGSAKERELRDAIIAKEERHVWRAKISVICVLFACAAAVSTVVYKFARDSDERNFDIEVSSMEWMVHTSLTSFSTLTMLPLSRLPQYETFAKQFSQLTQWEVTYNFALTEQLATSIITTTALTNSTFPYVTVPAYEVTGGYVDGMGGIMLAALAPLVKAEEQTQWEQYSVKNQGWVQESAYLKEAHPKHRDSLHGTYQDVSTALTLVLVFTLTHC